MTWKQVRRRQVICFAVLCAALVLLFAGMPLATSSTGEAGSPAAAAVLFTSLGVILLSFLAQTTAMTPAARSVLRTGDVPPGAGGPDLVTELRTRRGNHTFGLVMAASMLLAPVGAVQAVREGTATQPLVSWATALIAGLVLLGLVWGAWLWRRRRRVSAALRSLDG